MQMHNEIDWAMKWETKQQQQSKTVLEFDKNHNLLPKQFDVHHW